MRGHGLMARIELRPDSPQGESALCAATARIALRNGVLLFTCGTRVNCLKLIPPLVMDDRDCEFAVFALSRSLQALRS